MTDRRPGWKRRRRRVDDGEEKAQRQAEEEANPAEADGLVDPEEGDGLDDQALPDETNPLRGAVPSAEGSYAGLPTTQLPDAVTPEPIPHPDLAMTGDVDDVSKKTKPGEREESEPTMTTSYGDEAADRTKAEVTPTEPSATSPSHDVETAGRAVIHNIGPALETVLDDIANTTREGVTSASIRKGPTEGVTPTSQASEIIRSGEPEADQPGYAPRREFDERDDSSPVSDSEAPVELTDLGTDSTGVGPTPPASSAEDFGSGATGIAAAAEGLGELSSDADETMKVFQSLNVLEPIAPDVPLPVSTDPELDVGVRPADLFGEAEAPLATEETDETAADSLDLGD